MQAGRLRDRSTAIVGAFEAVRDVDKAAVVDDFGKKKDRRVARRWTESSHPEVAGLGMDKQLAVAVAAAEVAAAAGDAVAGGATKGFVMEQGRLRVKSADEGEWGWLKEGPLCCL